MAFVQDFKIIDHPYDEVVSHFMSGIGPLLEGGLEPARQEGERLRIKVAPLGWPSALAKTVEVRPGRVRTLGDSLLIGFTWEAAERSLFPRLDADLELAPFGAEQTLVAIRGRYDPPAGVLGRHADELLLNRLAESTIRAFLGGLCSAVNGSKVRG